MKPDPKGLSGFVPSHHVDQWFNEEGKLHREDGPAQVWASGIQEWYKNGKLHRMDGPAVIYPLDSHGVDKWYFEGKFICNSKKPKDFNNSKIYFRNKLRAFLDKVSVLQIQEVLDE